jgi:hypothetical protein
MPGLPAWLPKFPVSQLLGIEPKAHLGVTHSGQFHESKLGLTFDIFYLKVSPPPGGLLCRPWGTQAGD